MKAERGDEQRINKNWLIFHEKKIVFQTSNHLFIVYRIIWPLVIFALLLLQTVSVNYALSLIPPDAVVF